MNSQKIVSWCQDDNIFQKLFVFIFRILVSQALFVFALDSLFLSPVPIHRKSILM